MSAGSRSYSPSGQWYSTVTFWPSINRFLEALRNAPQRARIGRAIGPRKPTTGIAGCCARAASGHATAAPPSSAMNSRRRISAPKLRSQHCIGSNEYLDRG